MIVSADLDNFLGYFEDWANNSPDIKFFLYGGVELGMSHATGHPDFEYPFLWLEQPEIKTEYNDMGQYIERYVCGVSVIKNAPIDDPAAQRQASVDTMRIVYKLQKQMIADNKGKNVINIEYGMVKTEVDRGWAGNHRGWRMEFELLMNANPVLR